MREILFRGKTYDGRLVEGCLICAPNYTCILEAEEKVHPMDYPYLDGELGTFDGKATPVIPETVGQYTGLTDKNGTKIFEGDIVKATAGNLVGEPIVSKVIPNINDYELMWDIEHSYEREIVGTIHDNPELLGG